MALSRHLIAVRRTLVGRAAFFTIVALTASALASCGAGGGGAGGGGDSSTPEGRTATVRVVAVGDIACPPGEEVTPVSCQMAATADLTESLSPDVVIALGDLQYESGAASDFDASFDRSWGRLLPLIDSVPGNHEYGTAGAADYLAETGRRRPTWYAVDAGSWRAYLLDANCTEVDCQAEAAWLEADLKEHPTRCSLIATHQPRFSSGPHHSDATLDVLWQVAEDNGVDVALAGHDHDYERFRPMTSEGTADPEHGIASFVVGTGGKSLYEPSGTEAGSAFFQNTHFGVLDLQLEETGYVWAFHQVDGDRVDQGRALCH